jgi:hypothetical protein
MLLLFLTEKQHDSCRKTAGRTLLSHPLDARTLLLLLPHCPASSHRFYPATVCFRTDLNVKL